MKKKVISKDLNKKKKLIKLFSNKKIMNLLIKFSKLAKVDKKKRPKNKI